jgi:hypothetical protein
MMRALVESHSVMFAPMGPDIDLGKETAVIRDRAGNPIVGLVWGMRFVFKMLEASHEDILSACRGDEFVVMTYHIHGII